MEKKTRDDPAPTTLMTGKTDFGDDWLIDSGSTENITNKIEILNNRTHAHNENPIVIPNGDSIPVEGRGECTLPGGAKIKGVLHIPKFTCNLLSVSRLSKELQSAITFFPDFCVMQKIHTRSLIGAGKCRRGLYRMGTFGTEKRVLMATADCVILVLELSTLDYLFKIVKLKPMTVLNCYIAMFGENTDILLFREPITS